VIKAYVVSPAEPSGSSWLLNCLLELGVKVGHKPCVDSIWRKIQTRLNSDHIWKRYGDYFLLNPKADILRKWLPACTRHRAFAFKPDILVEYTQDFPAQFHDGHPVIYFIRDPRDAMYSMYRRLGPDMPCLEFARFPNPYTLLSRIHHWRLHVMAWTKRVDTKFLRFEDYKQDARGVLAEALDLLGIEADARAVATAVRESTFEKAVWGETHYGKSYRQDSERINRKGRVGDWRGRPDVADCVAFIERRTSDLMERFGYPTQYVTPSGTPSGVPESTKYLDFCTRLKFGSPEKPGNKGNSDQSISDVVSFVQVLDEQTLRRSRLRPDEVTTLLDSLAEFMEKHQGIVDTRLEGLRAIFAEGSQYHFERILELRNRRKKT
jgi:hypothetical protein